MIKSMTGFGKAEIQSGHMILTISLKSVNSKTLDLNLRMPYQFKEKENEVRKLLQKELTRGKIDLSVGYDLGANQNIHAINGPLLKAYVQNLKEASGDLTVSDETLFNIASRLPNVLSQEKEEFQEADWKACEKGIQSALAEMNAFRIREGNTLELDLKERIESIFKLLEKIESLAGERLELVKTRLRKQLEELQLNNGVNQERFEQELIYYLEKLDITEEQVRLKSHGNLFLDTLNEGSDQGRKLGFIAQEIGREINTIGSKANHAEIQKLVVHMKDELEKIKEQLFNIL